MSDLLGTRLVVSTRDLDSQVTKVCRKCNRCLPASEFYAKREAKDGLQSRCKTCNRATSREWMANHPDVGKAWAEANPEKVLEKSHRWRANHPDKQRMAMKRWFEANRERRARYNRNWTNANQEKRCLSEKRRDPDKRKARDHRRRARKKGNGGRGITAADIQTMRTEQKALCAYCGDDMRLVGETLDHVIPLNRGGEHDPTNAKLCCPFCNSSKGSKLLSEWLKS